MSTRDPSPCDLHPRYGYVVAEDLWAIRDVGTVVLICLPFFVFSGTGKNWTDRQPANLTLPQCQEFRPSDDISASRMSCARSYVPSY